MNDSNALAQAHILQPAGLSENDIEKALAAVMQHDVDAADLYFQVEQHESWQLEDGRIKNAGFSLDRGVGVRAMAGEKVGFAYSDDIILPALTQAVHSARAIARSGTSRSVGVWQRSQPVPRYQGLNPLTSLSDEQKVDLLRRADTAARAADNRVIQVMASLSGVYDTVLIAASDGTWASDIRPLVRMNVSVVVEQGGKREMASMGGGARVGYELFADGQTPEEYAREAVRQALVNLHADDAPAGTLPVVLGPGWPGVLLHEAVGHGLEGDFNRKQTSVYSGRIGEKVASEHCTIVDDGTLPDRRGSLNIDDEGEPGRCNVLIENGILKGFMQDKLNARLSGVAPTGNGRRESYAHLVMPRMTNTYMLPGQHEADDIIASVDHGVYAVNFGGGQVDITSGKFVFSASEAYMIEKGKVTRPIKGATLIGNGPDIMNRVSMVGNDLELDTGVGSCGKEGQSVPVGVGQPTLKIDAITVGGTRLG